MGFLVLVILISVLGYCLHKKRKVGKDDVDEAPKKTRSLTNPSMPSMPSITDCFTHAQFQSVVNFPKNDTPFHRQRSVRFNYRVILYGYDPQQTVRKSLKIKKKLNKYPA